MSEARHFSAPKKQHPTECCCGCSIKTGCLIIGWFGVIGGVLGCALYIAALTVSLSYKDTRIGSLYDYMDIVYAVGIPLAIIQTIVYALLIHGVRTGNPKLLNYWLVVAKIWLVLCALSLNCLAFALLWYFSTIVIAHRENLLEGKNTVDTNEVENPGYEIKSYENKSVEKSQPEKNQCNENV